MWLVGRESINVTDIHPPSPGEGAVAPAGLARDPAALDAFYREHVVALTGFFARRAATPAEVADLVADTFCAAIVAADRYDPRRGSPRAWLFGIASHVAVASYRSHARETAATVRLAGRRLLDESDEARLTERIAAEGHARALHDALGHLGDTDRRLLELVVLDQLSVDDAAHALGIRRSAARMRLSRARRRARAFLTDPKPPSTTTTIAIEVPR